MHDQMTSSQCIHMPQQAHWQCFHTLAHAPSLPPPASPPPIKYQSRSSLVFSFLSVLHAAGLPDCRGSAKTLSAGSTTWTATRHGQQYAALCCHERHHGFKLLGAAPGGYLAVRGFARVLGRYDALCCTTSSFHLAPVWVRITSLT